MCARPLSWPTTICRAHARRYVELWAALSNASEVSEHSIAVDSWSMRGAGLHADGKLDRELRGYASNVVGDNSRIPAANRYAPLADAVVVPQVRLLVRGRLATAARRASGPAGV